LLAASEGGQSYLRVQPAVKAARLRRGKVRRQAQPADWRRSLTGEGRSCGRALPGRRVF